MKGMKSLEAFYTPPAPGDYPATIIAAEPDLTKKGASMIKLTVALDDSNESFTDYIVTDATKAAGAAKMGKRKLEGIGYPIVTDDEVPDEKVCADLLGTKTIVTLGHEQQMDSDGAGNYNKPKFHTTADGKQVPAMRARIEGYKRHAMSVARAPQAQNYAPQATTNAAVVQAPQAQVQQYAQAPQYAPQAVQMAPQMPQQMAPAGYAPQQWQGQAPQQAYGQAPQQFAQAPQAAYPQAQAQIFQGQPGQPQQAFAQPAVAQPTWAVPPTVNGAEEGTKKGKRKMNIKDGSAETEG